MNLSRFPVGPRPTGNRVGADREPGRDRQEAGPGPIGSRAGTDREPGRDRRGTGPGPTGRGPGRLLPTGAPHVALLLPVDAVAPSRPPWIGGPCPVVSAVADEHVRGVPDRTLDDPLARVRRVDDLQIGRASCRGR